MKLGWPAEDLAGYTPGTPHADRPRRGRLAPARLPEARRSTTSSTADPASSCCPAARARRSSAPARWRPRRRPRSSSSPTPSRPASGATSCCKRTTLTAEEIGEYSGQVKEVKPVTIATYQILTAKRKGEYAHLALLDALDWGLVVYDEVHLLPAPVFKLTAELQARRRLGLTATLVREDGREGDVFSLIGPKRFDAPWKEIEAQGFISPAACYEVRIDLPAVATGSSTPPRPTTSATASRRPRPAKLGVVRQLVARHAGERILVIGQYLDQIDELAEALDAPKLTGATPVDERERLYQEFRDGRDEVLVVSQGGELLGRPARGDRRHPGLRIVRLAPGGGPAPRPPAAPEGVGPLGELLHARRARHRRPGLRAEPPALPRRAGLQLHDPRRARAAGRVTPAALSVTDLRETAASRRPGNRGSSAACRAQRARSQARMPGERRARLGGRRGGRAR